MRISDWSSDVCSSDLSMVWPFGNARAAGGLPVKLTAGGPGSAETLTLAVFKAYPDLLAGLDIDWVGGDPGQVQNLLLSGAVNSSAYGALGAAEASLKGIDIVLVGPKLANHGQDGRGACRERECQYM